MGDTVQIKMAAASQKERDAVTNFFQKLEEAIENFDGYDFGEHELSQEVQELFKKINAGQWERVVYGYGVLFDNVCDPTLSYLDWKPELKEPVEKLQAAEARIAELEASNQQLRTEYTELLEAHTEPNSFRDRIHARALDKIVDLKKRIAELEEMLGRAHHDWNGLVYEIALLSDASISPDDEVRNCDDLNEFDPWHVVRELTRQLSEQNGIDLSDAEGSEYRRLYGKWNPKPAAEEDE